MRNRGRCAVCRFTFPLRKDGTVQTHRLFIGSDRLPPCEGGGKKPLPIFPPSGPHAA